jgi:hypothetical protein
MSNNPCHFVQGTLVAARLSEVPAADWNAGCNLSASNGNVVGIATDNPGLDQGQQWTLLDQNGAARNPQQGVVIGDDRPDDVYAMLNRDIGNGQFEQRAPATLLTLEAGWTAGELPEPGPTPEPEPEPEPVIQPRQVAPRLQAEGWTIQIIDEDTIRVIDNDVIITRQQLIDCDLGHLTNPLRADVIQALDSLFNHECQ